MGGACGQGMDAVPQGTQALVDELGLPQAFPLGLSLTHPLAACQVHQPQLGPPYIPCACTDTHIHTCMHIVIEMKSGAKAD